MARNVLFDESQEELAKLEAAGEEFEEVKPLAEELIDTLIDLLFFSDFTIPRSNETKKKVTYAIWQSGVGCNTSIGTSKEFESNRTEVLRLLLTLTGQSMYMSANLLPVQGIKAISHIVTCPEKQIVLSLLCSLLNTVSTLTRILGKLLTWAVAQIQSCKLEGALQRPGIQGSQASPCDVRPTGSFELSH